MNLQGIKLSEKSQPTKVTYYTIPLLYSMCTHIARSQGSGIEEGGGCGHKRITGEFLVVMKMFCIQWYEYQYPMV